MERYETFDEAMESLRDMAEGCAEYLKRSIGDDISEIADRIEEAHEREMDARPRHPFLEDATSPVTSPLRLYMALRAHERGEDPIDPNADMLMDEIDAIDANLAGRVEELVVEMEHMVAPPTYEDGREVRVGDEVILCDEVQHELLNVSGICLSDDPDHQWTLELTGMRDKCHRSLLTRPTDGTIARSIMLGDGPTVADVLMEMLTKAVGFSDAHTTVALNVVSEYADRLELKEE